MGFLARLLALVAEAGDAAGGLVAGSQACHNLQAALGVVAALIAPAAAAEPATPSGVSSDHTAQNRQQLVHQRFPSVLVGLSLGATACPDPGVRAEVRPQSAEPCQPLEQTASPGVEGLWGLGRCWPRTVGPGHLMWMSHTKFWLLCSAAD